MASAAERAPADSPDSCVAETQASETPPREQLFSQFYDSTDFLEILRIFESLCTEIGVDSTQHDGFYASIKERLTTWKAGALWQLLDARAGLPEYEGQKACVGKKVLVIGAGPVGLRAAIEAALLGASVDLVERRNGFTRNNSLHLWPFLITDLRNLGAKKFYGKFAAGSIDHICIRILQGVLLKVCLLLGVKVYPGVTFTGLVEPKNANSGWSVTTNPTSCPVSSPSQNYDIILAADGKKNSLPGFRTKEFRAKLALAITVNFVNHNTKQESSVPEISGVAYVYRQDFFNSMAKKLGIALENIVYYKDETHYFVMTAKKHSLINRGVLKKDENDPKRLLSPENIDKKALERYAVEATAYATEGALGDVEFEKNHRGENDVALFDFTSLFASENAARIIERKGKRILLCVAGDSLLEPFWPTGSGCARGFLGAFDAAWMMKGFASGADPISLLEEREAILYLLPQTTPERLQKNLAGYTIDPKTRYTNLSELVPPGDVMHLYDTDDPNVVNVMKSRALSTSMRRGHRETKSTAVSTQEEAKPKRSRSIEGLASRSQSLESPFEIPSKERAGAAKPVTAASLVPSSAGEQQSGEQAAQKARHFWQKKPTTAAASAGNSNNKGAKLSGSKEERKKDIKRKEKEITPSSSKPPLPTSAKEKKRFGASGTSAAQPSTSQQSTSKVQDKKSDLSSAKAVKASPPASPELSKKKKHSLFGGKARARSESPERSPKKSSKRTSSKDSLTGSGGGGGHPLQAATSVKSLDRESATVGEGGPSAGTNVLDIIKRYDQRDEVVKGHQSKPPGHEKVVATTSSTQPEKPSTTKTKGQKADSAKKEAVVTGGKGKGPKEKPTKEDKKKEGKEGSSSKGLLSFFKRGKAHEEDKQHKKKAKKDKEKESKPTGKESSKAAEKKEPEHQLTIKGRIERLKESGVYTDGSDGTDGSPVVLVSVTKHTEDEEGERTDDLSPPSQQQEEETDRLSGGADGAEAVGGGVGERDTGCASEGEEVESKPGEPAQLDGGGEGENEEVVDAVDRVKRLQSLFQSVPERSPALGRSLSTSASGAKRSKEIDLSDLLIRETKSEGSSHPLWLARIIQSLNKCLERLRKENDVIIAKTALVILNTIISNVHAHPDDDVYRRVRVSSERFVKKVWQYSNARQFLARAGWVEIDDFIVLPIGSKVDIPKRILDKHLDIVNQMLWSMQLEIPDSPGVLKRRPPNPIRERSLTVMKRSSYASRVVEESLEQVEQDQQAMAAAMQSKRIGSESSASISTLQGVDRENEDISKGEMVTAEDYLDSAVVPESRSEEVQTMRAASAARTIWLQREIKKEEAMRERKYRLILETELYDLPPPSATDSLPSDSDLRSRSPEDQVISFIAGGVAGGVAHHDRRASKTQVETLAEVPEEETEANSGGMENISMGTELSGGGSGIEHQLRKLTLNKSASQQSNRQQTMEVQLGNVEEASSKEGTNGQPLSEHSTQISDESLSEKTSSEKTGGVTPSVSLPTTSQEDNSTTDVQVAAITTPSNQSTSQNKKLDNSSSGDQLRQLLLNVNTSQAAASSVVTGGGGSGGRATSPGLTTGSSPSPADNGEGGTRMREGCSPSPPSEEPKMSTADAQHPSESAIKSGRLEYERLAIQAASETRQKWKETEASLTTNNNKDERSAL